MVPSSEEGGIRVETISAVDSFKGFCCKRTAEKQGWGWKKTWGVDFLKMGNTTVCLKQVGEVILVEEEETDHSEDRWGN